MLIEYQIVKSFVIFIYCLLSKALCVSNVFVGVAKLHSLQKTVREIIVSFEFLSVNYIIKEKNL
jgi:hypothetical protein